MNILFWAVIIFSAVNYIAGHTFQAHFYFLCAIIILCTEKIIKAIRGEEKNGGELK
jgi:hypothetical protein